MNCFFQKNYDQNDENSTHQFNHENLFYRNHNGNNPFICKYFGNIKNPLTIIIEYINGKTLDEFIKEHSNLDVDKKINIILDIMCAIECLHLNNFIYRDLKPDNIIIDNNFNAILFDFDQSKKIDGSKMTSDIGSLVTTSPEQNTGNYSFPTDIFSLGKIIQFIFSGNYTLYPDISKCPTKYVEYYDEYKSCFEIHPEIRPNISDILNSFFIIYYKNNNDSEVLAHLQNIFNIRKNLLNFSILRNT